MNEYLRIGFFDYLFHSQLENDNNSFLFPTTAGDFSGAKALFTCYFLFLAYGEGGEYFQVPVYLTIKGVRQNSHKAEKELYYFFN